MRVPPEEGCEAIGVPNLAGRFCVVKARPRVILGYIVFTVEETLRRQKQAWSELAPRIFRQAMGELPKEQPQRILFFGLGSSHFAARLCAATLQKDQHWRRVPIFAASSMSIGGEIIPQRGDWAFGLSHRGGSRPTSAALELCERAGALTAWICGKGVPQPSAARCQFETVEIEKVEPHTLAVTSAICVLTTLLLGASAMDEWVALGATPDPDLQCLRSVVGEGPSLLLGEWAGEWLAREGALKLMEMARLPVRVFGSEEFFHGPRFSHACERPRAVWHVRLSNDPRNADIDAKLKPDYVVRVGDRTPLAWVSALVELQWLALAVALNRQLNPDQP